MRAAVVCVALALVAAVAAVPVSHHRLQKIAAAGALQAQSQARVTPPALSGSFHVQYSIYGLNTENAKLIDAAHMPVLSAVANWFDKLTHLLDGEAWQNIDAAGAVTIKTITTPRGLGTVIVPASTSTWVVDHGWTEQKGTCAADTVNSQLVIPGDVLQKTGKFMGTKKIKTFKPQAVPAPDSDGTYTVDQWDATLPNGEGSVSYYLLHGVAHPTPIMSHYLLKGKPPAWAQYTAFQPVVNPPAIYAPSAVCQAAAAAAKAAPAHTSNASASSASSAAPPPLKK